MIAAGLHRITVYRIHKEVVYEGIDANSLELALYYGDRWRVPHMVYIVEAKKA